MTQALKALWAYRGFIVGSVKRDFQARYRNSLLGSAWAVINPLAMIVVYTVIFSQVMRARLPGLDTSFGYSIYLCAGIITWGLFAEIVGRAQNMFLENANLLKKLSFPRECLPVIVVANAGINFAVIFALFTVFLMVSGNVPGLTYLAMLPVLLIQVAFSIGLGVALGVLNVFFRDVGALFGVIIQFWFWLTPIVYPVTILPEFVQSLMVLNPMAAIVGAYQAILVFGHWPTWMSLVPVTAVAILLCAWGLHLLHARGGEMIDEL